MPTIIIMNEKELLLYMLEEIEQKTTSNNPYRVLTLSKELRQLLIDSHSIIDHVNKDYKIKIVYRVNDISHLFEQIPGMPAFDFRAPYDLIEPGLSNLKIIDLKKDAFLNFKIMCTKGHLISVKDIIRTTANKFGGVHFDKSNETQAQEVLRNLNSELRVANGSAITYTLVSIARIVLTALSPLITKIQKI